MGRGLWNKGGRSTPVPITGIEPFGVADGLNRGLITRLDRKLVGVHAPRESYPVAFDANGVQARRGLRDGNFPGLVGGKGESHAFDSGGADGLEKFVG